MPCNYKLYPANWKTEIVPRILKRAQNCCEKCGVPNGVIICRGLADGQEVWQDDEGYIYSYPDKRPMGQTYVGWIRNARYVRIVLTIAHKEHDLSKNTPDDLAAWCQMCHNRHDIKHRLINRKITITRKKGLNPIPFVI